MGKTWQWVGPLALALALGCSGGDDGDGAGGGSAGGGEPRQAPPGAAQVVQPGDVPDVELAPLQGAMGTEVVHVAVTGTGEVDEVGTGDAATLPADGEHFVVAEVVVTPVAPSPVLDDVTRGEVAQRGNLPRFAVAVPAGDVDGLEIEVDETATAPQTYLVAASVPEGGDTVDLVMTADDVEQRVSLLTGAPGPDNNALLARVNRELPAPVPGQALTFHGTEISQEFHRTETVGVAGASLQWVPGAGDDRTAPPGRAFLHVALDVNTANWALGSELRLADGTVVAPMPDVGDPEVLRTLTVPVVVFDVPADLTEATLVLGKDYRWEIPGGGGLLTADFDTTVEYPLAIPAPA
jgi:hypothetical protein